MAKLAYMVGLLAAGVALVGCSPFGGASAFTCETSDQCGTDGQCEANGLCSYVNIECPSGRSYGINSGDQSGACVPGGTPTPDAPPDSPPVTQCTPNETACNMHVLETCNATGTGYDASKQVVCPLTCLEMPMPACVAARIIPDADQMACSPNAPALTPPSTATITFNATSIDCDPICSPNVTSIPRTGTVPNSWYCLSSLNLPAGTTIERGTLAGAISLFVHNAATVDATIDLSGVAATATTAGAGGPGGFPGGALSANDSGGRPGGGNCGGGPGAVGDSGADAAGGGGGGGGYAAVGGTGGDGRGNQGGGEVAPGGTAGVTTCDSPTIMTLVGGSGGGGGGDGACGSGVACGWPGGGGGGALQLVSRVRIDGAGNLTASGGNGYGDTNRSSGGGGGGAGGAILLETPSFMFAGPIAVNGGTGGTSNGGNAGGPGAAGANLAGGNGGDQDAKAEGGGGAGGAGGRIRINTVGGACPAGVSPTMACSTGTLRAP